ncbi:glycosyltransferase family 2 protein [Nocardioides immobilis]|uniref:Glycosyltransferase family 2 protein n=1 Tax=Nocardioides immobilis TaxID=2049295 RepID=A0A417XSQ3_9ACTN|nr:glycosyltransferase family 2 protein [Nocardioides immobilis]RHW23498.1 glycosyltransferase family 2 protein [Nocardioides immobilis]
MAPPAAPVALFVFNRPDLTEQVFEVIRAAKPPVLLVSADGPRPDRPEDERLCRETREIVHDVDWPCDVHWNLREVNLGCGPAMSQGISWVFDHVDRAIILEDDCVPDPTFFPFCDELLERYKDDSRILQIAGSNLAAPAATFGDDSYSFASFPLVWGWATWRRAWAHYDFGMRSWPAFRDSGMLAGLHNSRRRQSQLRREWDHIHAGNGTWDHQWQYTVMSQHGLSVYPATNLVSNLGFRADATQTTAPGSMAEIPARAIALPLAHPPLVAHNPRLESLLDREVLRAIGTAVTVLRKVLPSKRARRALRRVLLPTARHGPGSGRS